MHGAKILKMREFIRKQSAIEDPFIVNITAFVKENLNTYAGSAFYYSTEGKIGASARQNTLAYMFAITMLSHFHNVKIFISKFEDTPFAYAFEETFVL